MCCIEQMQIHRTATAIILQSCYIVLFPSVKLLVAFGFPSGATCPLFLTVLGACTCAA